MTSLPGMKKTIWLPNADLLVFKVLLDYKKNAEHLFRQTNSQVQKRFYKRLKSRSPFRF